MSDDLRSDELECSYCGKILYADAARCPKCDNYTDGLGPRARADTPLGRKISRVYIFAGLLVVFAMLLPIALEVISWLKRR